VPPLLSDFDNFQGVAPFVLQAGDNGRGIFATYVGSITSLTAVPVPAVPLPAALPLLATSLAFLGYLTKRRRSALRGTN
jgi:hypothetical protein